MKVGDTVWIIESAIYVKEVVVVSLTRDYAVIRYPSGGGYRVRRSRLFATKDEALAKIAK